MVNLLEGLYVVTMFAFIGAYVAFYREKKVLARRLAYTAALLALFSIFMYWYLGRST